MLFSPHYSAQFFFSRCYFRLVILACVILALVLYSPHMQTISLCLKFPQTWSPYVQMYIYIKKSLPANDTGDWGKNKTRVNISLYTVSVVALGFIKAISTHYSHPSYTHTVKPLKWWLLLKINNDIFENLLCWWMISLGIWVKICRHLSLWIIVDWYTSMHTELTILSFWIFLLLNT